jgi:D-threo-aldose 1-dehydrogenase
MRSTRLGQSVVEVTSLGYGAAEIGNLYREVSQEDAAEAVNAAWTAGVRYFDTAPHYGLGLSERRLGAALAARPRDAFVVSTKVGRLLEPADPCGDDLAEGFAVPADHRRVWDFSAAGVRRSLESSLERLRLDRVDVLLIHDPDDHMQEALSTGFPALADLRRERTIRAIGVGTKRADIAARFVRETDVDVVLVAGRYTLLEQPALDDLLPLCVERGVSVLAAGVFNTGLLAEHDVPESALYEYASAPPGLVARARKLALICTRYNVSLPQAALAFPLGHPAVASVIVGVHDPEQMRTNGRLFGRPVPADLWAELRDERLIRADAPVPADPIGW